MDLLRPYQEQAVNQLREVLRSGKRCPILVSPTGSGKSVTLGKVISLVVDNGKKVLWLVHRRNLVFQMKGVLEDYFGIKAGVIMAGIEPALDELVQLATLQTYSRRIELGYFSENKICFDPDIIIIDECHRSCSKSYQDILSHYPDKIVIGTTATPLRADQRGLGEVYDSIVDVIGVKELVDLGYLSPMRYFAPVQIDLEGVRTAMGDYIIKDLDGKLNKTKLIGDIVENWLRIAEGRKTIVFAVNVKHSKAICEEFNKQGVKAEHLDAHSKDDEREDVFRRMQNGDITIICNVALYQEGLDVPNVACIVFARPTKSLGLFRQCGGRGMRIADGKLYCIFIDHGNALEEHGLLDWEIEWSLDGRERAWPKPSREKTDKLVKCCACHKVFEGSNTCPDGGTKVRSYGKKILTVEAELEEIDEKKKSVSVTDKRVYLGMLKTYVSNKGWNPKAVNAKYRGKFGVWPHSSIRDVAPIEPDMAFLNMMKSDMIRYFKGKEKADSMAKEGLKRGGELAEKHRFQSSQG